MPDHTLLAKVFATFLKIHYIGAIVVSAAAAADYALAVLLQDHITS